MTLEEIARLGGHSSTAVTKTVYRHELRPVIQSGADVMDQIFAVGKPKVRRKVVRQSARKSAAATDQTAS